jgi:nicotinate dehydrogenase subunit B
MNRPMALSRRAALKGGALTVGLALAGVPARVKAQGAAASRVLDAREVDAYLTVNTDAP